MQKVAEILRSYIRRNHLPEEVKECAKTLDVPLELFRKTLNEGHIPRDLQLLIYARKLNMSEDDTRSLILSAHYERSPKESRIYLEQLKPTPVFAGAPSFELSEDEEDLVRLYRGSDLPGREDAKYILERHQVDSPKKVKKTS